MQEIKKGALIALGEMFLKSEGVKKVLKKRLVQNLAFFLKKQKVKFKIYPFHERVFVETKAPRRALAILKKVFGISWVAQGFFFEEGDLKDVCAFIKENWRKWIKQSQTFALRVKEEKTLSTKDRLGKEKIIDQIAKIIKRKVDLSRPGKEIFIERRKRGWFLYFKKMKAEGGLPVGCAGRIACLISGGIDSPVASFLISKRGAENIWLHFHSYPLVSNKSIEKVKELAKVFLNYQPGLKIYFIPFQDAQMEIKAKIPAKYRILLYRRLMLKIGEAIAQKEKCQALVTGEALGQVSSQTLTNLGVMAGAVKMPIFRPLIGMDKQEIISLAKKIGTFDISIKPQEDCCTLFTPKHPTAQGKLKEVKNWEKKLDINKITAKAIKKSELIIY